MARKPFSAWICRISALVSLTAGLIMAPAVAAAQVRAGAGQPIRPTEVAFQLPVLELVGTFGCDSCAGPDKLSGTEWPSNIAAGPGNSFAAVTRVDPGIRIWDLDAHKTTQLTTYGPDAAQLTEPAGLVFVRDTVLIAEQRVGSPKFKAFSPVGQLLVGYSGPTAEELPAISTFVGSPSGRWVVARYRSAGGGFVYVRTDRATNETELLDVPSGLTAGSFSSGSSIVSAAISDDGTVAMGYGETAYRLLLIPLSGARTEGGRAIPPRPKPREVVARLEEMMKTNPSRRFNLDFPFFDGPLAFDAVGRLWVKTAPVGGESPASTTFDVFSPTLQYLGEVRLDGFATDLYHIGPQLLVARTLSSVGDGVRVWRIKD